MQPDQNQQGDKTGDQPGVVNNVTINQASAQPANDVTHALNVHYQNAPAMGR
ncbi:MAG: hypothetical protein WB989_08440 [Mycobacterium sp.]